MQSTKPYLIRAIHQWCVDQGFTPYLSVQVDDLTRVPREFVREGEIVLNVGYDATNQLELGNESISFQARFSGRVFPVYVPVERVAAIYARENGQGMAFPVSETALPHTLEVAVEPAVEGAEDGAPEPDPTPRAPARGHLTRVK